MKFIFNCVNTLCMALWLWLGFDSCCDPQELLLVLGRASGGNYPSVQRNVPLHGRLHLSC